MSFTEIFSLAVEGVIVLATMGFSLSFARKEPGESRKAYAISVVLFFGVLTGFSVVQLMTALKVVAISMTYTPFEVLSMISLIYWFGFFLRKTSMFDKITG